ncbi:MAG: 2-oxo acid dehydrogenase subunit E2, partial [Oscillospiraceae bacterium]|nr:2-oxo acid dehydrogenase subunit E2 [Oscillospiraceae bacterium]
DYPQINRFVAGQKMYAHTRADVSMMVKRSMNIDAEETAVKVTFDQQSGPAEIYQKFNEVVMGEKGAPEPEKPKGGFDKTAFWFNLIPGFLLRFVFWVIRCLDYVGLLPKFLVGVSPFHASLFVTSMGSLGIPAIYHHLYDFGTVSIFLSYGAIRHEFVPDTDGTMKLKKYVDYVVTVDERICDGYYYAQVLKRMKELLENPELLDTPFEVQDDIK